MEKNNVAAQSTISTRTGFWKGCRCGGNRKTRTSTGCNSIVTSDPVQKPDLAIYSQEEELSNGNIPNYDSPDIITNSWRPFRLRNEANVKVRNLSPSVPAINTLVHYATSPFGIGTQQERKLTKVVNLAPNQEIELNFPLDASTLEGDPRVGVHIMIEHPHDPNQVNNYGSQVHDGGYTTESGRTFSIQIPVFNDSNFTRQINLTLMPTDVIASLNTTSHVFAPYEQLIVTLNIEIPGFLNGAADSIINRAVTAVGRLNDGTLIGGVTRLIRIDN